MLWNFQESVDDFRSVLRRLRKVPLEVDQVLELLKLGVQVITLFKVLTIELLYLYSNTICLLAQFEKNTEAIHN